MISIQAKRIKEIKRSKRKLEKKLNIKIRFDKCDVLFEGESLDEYQASLIFEAINLGFSAETALLILENEITFETINIKDHTRRKNLLVVRGRLIGTRGKTKNTLEEISGCKIKIQDNIVGLIGHAENIKNATTAITNIIRGSKQTNAYKYLERINTKKKKR
ncbi:MAG: KH domain-containing protein [Candidatus Pacearchaeota archaeon]|nr:KH domain-containing protein [Candidatus Pacearchaeota archaeon]